MINETALKMLLPMLGIKKEDVAKFMEEIKVISEKEYKEYQLMKQDIGFINLGINQVIEKINKIEEKIK